MNKIAISNVDLDIYHEVIDNGLNVYIVPKDNVNGFYVTYTTRFGANDIAFYSNDKDKMITVPYGIAHFLEHKMFESEDGIDPFTKLGELGLDCNANTNDVKTTYLFRGTDNFESGLEILLDFVAKPYFTDKNVEKEKGIIASEINMYLDDPYTRLFEKMKYNLFIKHPYKYTTAGSIDDINKITKEDLYECYNTFYHPSNMILVITGNVDPNKVISLVKENQKKKKFKKSVNIQKKIFNEPNKVSKKEEDIYMNVSIPKINISYKVNCEDIKIDPWLLRLYLVFLLDSKFGLTSDLLEKLKNDGVITDSIGFSVTVVDKFIVLSILAETPRYEEFITSVLKEMENLDIKESDFNRYIKTSLSDIVFSSDNFTTINDRITQFLVRYNYLIKDEYDIVKDMDYKTMKMILKKINIENRSILKILPNK